MSTLVLTPDGVIVSCVLSVLICSGWELREQLQWRHSLDSVGALPQRGGLKDYAPDGSWLQERKLENFHCERLSILREERVHTKCVFARVSFLSHVWIILLMPCFYLLF